jgi:ABC-type transport system involved in multi-copper enzyme maturation permease subunit
MRTELAALRSVPSFRRALAAAIALAGVLTITVLGVKDLARSTTNDMNSALASGAVAGLVALAYAGGVAGGEVARGGLALALMGGRSRRRGVRDRLLAHGAAGAAFGVAAAVTAGVLTFLLLGFGGAHEPTAGMVAGRAGTTVLYAVLMGVLGAALGLAVRSPAAALAVASDLEPAWQAGLALVAYAGVLGAVAAALTERRDVP